ncbi:MAG: CoA-binding protein [Bellilinea sp.]|nr:MAG: CoA-binding protein [Bellilinea sp.]
MDAIFYPRSIVVAGVSDKPDNLARHIASNLIEFGYRGQLYLLGRSGGQILDRPIYSSVTQLPPNIDLAVILTPAATVPGLMDELGAAGVRYAVIESAGFSEFSEEGAKLEEDLCRIAHKWGMRLVGPNCLGIICTNSGICTFFIPTAPAEIPPGRVSLVSQSGGVVMTCIDLLAAAGLGIAKSVSVGNKVDLKESDYLHYFIEDKATEVILLYLESIVEGRRLVELAAQSPKPVIVYKSNTSQASAQIAQSHTAALANDEAIVNAAFRQFGITRAMTFREMMIYSKGFTLPPVRGNRLGVFSRSGGHAIIAVDCASQFGFELPPYSDALIEVAKPFFRVNVIERMNPLDLGTVFNFEAYPVLIEEAIKLDQADAFLLIFNYRRETISTARTVAEKIKAISQQYQIPIALCYFTEADEVNFLEKNLGFPLFSEVHEAVQALAASRDYHHRVELLRTAQHQPPAISLPKDAPGKAQWVFNHTNSAVLPLDQAIRVCEAYGLPVAPWATVYNLSQAVEASARIGYPVAVKAISEQATHKTDVGGIALNIPDQVLLAAAILEMGERFEQQGLEPPEQFLIQKMLSGGREVILGGKRDPSFGPVLLLGLGGIYAEALQDVSMRLAPLTHLDVEEMLEELRAARLLHGIRGQPPADRSAIIDAMLRLSQMMVDNEEILEIDLNPALVFEHGLQVVDARLILKS